MLDEARRSLDAGEVVGAYAVASLIEYHFNRLNVSTALFTDWADIDRTNSILGKLGVLLADASKHVTAAAQQEVRDGLRWQQETPELEELIRLAEERDKMPPEVRELAQDEDELQKTKMPKCFQSRRRTEKSIKQFLELGGAALFIGVFLVLLGRGEEDDLNAMAGFIAIAGFITLIVSALAYGALNACNPSDGSPEAEEYSSLLNRVARAKHRARGANVSAPRFNEQRLKQLAEKFGGDGPVDKFIALRKERAQRWDALFGVARCDKLNHDP